MMMGNKQQQRKQPDDDELPLPNMEEVGAEDLLEERKSK